MKELDLLLLTYLREHWPAATLAERAAFERILELPDPQLAAYLLGREVPAETEIRQVLALVRRGVVAPVAGASHPAARGAKQP